jgi:hypothetical protein
MAINGITSIILDILCLSDSFLLFHLLARMPFHLFMNDAYILGTNHESLDDTTTVLRCDNGHVVVFSVSPDSLTPFKCDSGSLEILAKKGI